MPPGLSGLLVKIPAECIGELISKTFEPVCRNFAMTLDGAGHGVDVCAPYCPEHIAFV